MKTWIGTSGFQYKEWKGSFYPEKLSLPKMLAFYAGEFPSTEINYTFRSLPSEKTITRWAEETPDDFRFSLKAPQRVTHFAKLRKCGQAMNEFRQAVTGLGCKLGPVLFQLPETFTADAPLLADFLDSMPKGLRAAFEFRHASWFADKVFDALAARNAALCIAESEELETPRIATADFGYMRLRRDRYTTDEIAERAEFIRSQEWKEAFAYLKHEDTAAGTGYARQLMAALE
ncbi:DUF72 domain-containing protein [Luteolibacter flavescens]|uniref:DUF72 domain-containing protein n=1 Tax=Luteolibacter flavescens TaxID=1859460 RepID=A0ABT3FSL9_9BACT|nr:DUF72 domain-containing protein [Luteolibacter flavescens]MCW1886547.1 DUF72 domain-containing protein [Luteolibacter flavescens]